MRKREYRLSEIPVKRAKLSDWISKGLLDIIERIYNCEMGSVEVAIRQLDYIDEDGNKSIINIVGKNCTTGEPCPTSVKIPSSVPNDDVHEYLLNNFDWEVESFGVEQISIVDED